MPRQQRASDESSPWSWRGFPGSRRAAFLGLVVLGLAGVFVPMAFSRIVDADEGIYLLNSRAQMFLLTYVYASWLKLVGVSWYAGRSLSAIFAIALGTLVTHHVTLSTGDRAWGLLAAVLFAPSTLALGWYSVVKTFALGTLLLFAVVTNVLGVRPAKPLRLDRCISYLPGAASNLRRASQLLTERGVPAAVNR